MTIDRTTAPQPGPPRPYHFPHVARRSLDNGLRLLVAENHNAPLVSLRSLVRSGADYDTPELAGLASLTGELLDEGAGTRDAVRLAEDLGLLGASLGSGADWDASYVSVDSLSRTFAEAFAIFADVNRQPLLPQASLERVQSERLMELLQQRDEAGSIASKRFSNLIYGNGAYGNTVIGNPESVARITVDDVRRYYATHYLPNNGSIVIAGDVDAEAALDAASRFFRDWPAADLPARPEISPKTFESSRIYLIDRPTAVQSEIRIGHIGIARSTEDYFSLSVMNALLGGVFNSRINLNLREKHGYTYGARSMFAFRRQAGPFVVSAPVRNEVTRESVTEVLSELRRIRTGDVETQELDDTKNYLMGSFPSTVQSSSDIAGRLLDMELYDLPTDYFDRYRENIGAVSKSDVEHVAQKYIDPDRVIIVIVGNATQIREPLGSLGMPIHELDIEGWAIG
ncbi:MAG TPA: pitrilysin family protein [Thermoanaerobaculia bacterium]|jgi:zinc protease|nr:pitrilysin family protein [Thermoanaerobaculia bacterium]